MSERPRLLILSFSNIISDGRVMKQVRLFTSQYSVTTCGFGPAPHPDVEHIEVPAPVPAVSPRRARMSSRATEALKATHLYRAAYWRQPYARQARAALRGLQFDAVIANDADTLVLANMLVPLERVHADLHEYWPLDGPALRGHRRFVAGYYLWLCGQIAGRAASSTTVAPGIAIAYQDACGFTPQIVPNVAPYHELVSSPAEQPLRLVYAGVGAPSRGIHKLVDATLATTADVTLDLYLMPFNQVYIEELRMRAEQTSGKITVHDGVPQAEVVTTLNRYDVGAYLMEPDDLNGTYALPNKLFDFIQARLGVIVGPNPEMARIVKDTGVGAVTEGFRVEDLVRVLDETSVADVDRWKAASAIAAREWSAERVQHVWDEAIAAIVARPVLSRK